MAASVWVPPAAGASSPDRPAAPSVALAPPPVPPVAELSDCVASTPVLLLVVDPPLLTVVPPVLATAASSRAVFPPELGEVVPPLPSKVRPASFVVDATGSEHN